MVASFFHDFLFLFSRRPLFSIRFLMMAVDGRTVVWPALLEPSISGHNTIFTTLSASFVRIPYVFLEYP